MEEREPGFYWVRIPLHIPQWIVAQYDGYKEWTLTGVEVVWADSEFAEIGPHPRFATAVKKCDGPDDFPMLDAHLG